MRIGIIDVGSSSVRLLVVQVGADGSMRSLAQGRRMTRLGDGLAANGRLDDDAASKSLDAIESMAAQARQEGAEVVQAFATAAVREAENGVEFANAVRERIGLELTILTGADEARTAFSAVDAAMDLGGKDAVVFDLGGGSLQIIHARRGVIVSNVSLKLGAVRTHRLFSGPKGVTPRRAKELAKHVDKTLAGGLEKGLPKPEVVVGVGGTMTTLLAMARGQRNASVAAAEPVMADVVGALREQIEKTPLIERSKIPGLPTDRVDVILPGLVVVERLLAHLGVESVIVSEIGLREGLVLRSLRERAGLPERMAGDCGVVRQFASMCAYDAAHSAHVARLSLSLYDQLGQASGDQPALIQGDSRERRLLEAASIAHDVGVFVEYRAHHRHSMAMILNAEWSGWNEEDKRLVALIARYHRKAEPAKRHAEYSALSKEERSLVRRLSAVLRVADGLDRSHTQAVRGVGVKVARGRCVLEVDALGDVAVDLAGAKSKCGLFEDEFGVKVRFEHAMPAESEAPAIVSATPRPRRRSRAVVR